MIYIISQLQAGKFEAKKLLVQVTNNTIVHLNWGCLLLFGGGRISVKREMRKTKASAFALLLRRNGGGEGPILSLLLYRQGIWVLHTIDTTDKSFSLFAPSVLLIPPNKRWARWAGVGSEWAACTHTEQELELALSSQHMAPKQPAQEAPL